MKDELTGGCACGLVRYACSENPVFSLLCQCRQCQRITGTGHAAQFAVALSATVIEGTLQTFTLTSDSGNEVKSCFCGNCGNPIYKTTTSAPELIVFHAATLDEPSQFAPQMIVHSDSAQPWDHIDPNANGKHQPIRQENSG